MRITLPYLHSVGVALFPPDPHFVQVSLCDIRTEGRVQGAPEGRTTTTGEVILTLFFQQLLFMISLLYVGHITGRSLELGAAGRHMTNL